MYIKTIYEEVRVLQQDGNYYSTVRIGNKVVMDAIKVTGIIKE